MVCSDHQAALLLTRESRKVVQCQIKYCRKKHFWLFHILLLKTVVLHKCAYNIKSFYFNDKSYNVMFYIFLIDNKSHDKTQSIYYQYFCVV